jgi:hypothetical protein
MTRLWMALAALLLGTGVQAQTLRLEVLDDFRDTAAWKATASDQVKAALRRDRDGSLCLDYDFAGVSGYAVMRRALPVSWPERFDLLARIKGAGATNDFQFKLVDTSGENVWWVNRPNAALPRALDDLKLRKRHIDFAWGPTPDRALKATQFVEFVIAAGRDGGRGSLCVARLTLSERAPDPSPWPAPQRLAAADAMDIDWQQPREFNGLLLRWPAAQRAGFDYDVLGSADGKAWRLLRRVRGSDGGVDAIHLPESEWRHLRIADPRMLADVAPVTRPAKAAGKAGAKSSTQDKATSKAKGKSKAKTRTPSKAQSRRKARAAPAAPLRAALVPLEWPELELRSAAQWPDVNKLLAELAAAAPRGDMPRAYLGEQNYWNLVGVDGGGERSGLIGEDGAIEVGRGGFSIEPVVRLPDGNRVTWAQATITHDLRDGYLPIPRVRWQHAAFALDIEAAADGPREQPHLLARYTVRNTGAQAQTFTLSLAVRPWQVNPPQQFLATPGGASPIRMMRFADGLLTVNERQRLRLTHAPQRAAALPFDGGLGLAALQSAPALSVMGDPQAHASASLDFSLTLAAGASATLGWTAPLGPGAPAPAPLSAEVLEARIDKTAAHWRERLNRSTLRVPADAQAIADTLRSSLAHMLISRDGPALRPGTRSYNRSWVRDGAMMVAGLVRLGEIEAAREFTDWFAGYIFDSGKVPCCVDQRGADPVVENDSHGQYLYAVAEVWRHSGDRAFLQRHWPRVQRVTAWMEALRQSERSDANRAPERVHFFGLMPPSISHEGYSDKPAYSYWDDFWALRGYKDAVHIARALGQASQARAWAAARDEFERELGASITATARRHGIGFIAGAADRGDFDATSTTMALNPAQAAVPAELLATTFERYWTEMNARSEGTRPYKDYTPYELRNVGALARLGRPDRAHAMLRFFFADQRPRGWNQWAEVVLPNVREPRFLGDMPHAWVSSDFVRSALDLFAYEREADDALVVGAGWKPEWLASGEPIELRGLSTPFGPLDFSLRPHAGGWTLALPRALQGLRGGVRLVWPPGMARPRALHDGRELAFDAAGELRLPDAPSTVELLRDGAGGR